jgi:type IV secretion system protein VirB9
MRKTLIYVLIGLSVLSFVPSAGAAPEAEAGMELEKIPNESNLIEIEYEGKLIKVDIDDLILMADENGGEKVGLGRPEKYTAQLLDAPFSAPDEKSLNLENLENPEKAAFQGQEITEREHEEERMARRWTDITADLTLREADKKALELVSEYGEAKNAVPPIIGAAGSVVFRYSSYTPKIVCRPMYVTDVILQPGEVVTGVHPGDPVRWSFVPGKSGTGDTEQIHVLIKPLMADISTNLVVNTDRRTYLIDLMSSAGNFIPSVSFSYPDDSQKAWDAFMAEKKKADSSALSSGYTVNPEDLHLNYEIRGKASLRWKPVRVWDDGVKTFIQFKKGSTKKSVEAPILLAYEHKKEVLVNYRVAEDMYIADRVMGKAALIAGTGAHQDRVVITRKTEVRVSSSCENRKM